MALNVFKISENSRFWGQGSFIGNQEFDSHTNHNTDYVPESDRFKFVDDLTFLEVISLVNIGLSSHNIRQQASDDLPTHDQVVGNAQLKSQAYLDQINLWTVKQEMEISEEKKLKS